MSSEIMSNLLLSHFSQFQSSKRFFKSFSGTVRKYSSFERCFCHCKSCVQGQEHHHGNRKAACNPQSLNMQPEHETIQEWKFVLEIIALRLRWLRVHWAVYCNSSTKILENRALLTPNANIAGPPSPHIELLPWQLAIENGVKFGHSSPNMHRSLALEFEFCLTGGSRITYNVIRNVAPSTFFCTNKNCLKPQPVSSLESNHYWAKKVWYNFLLTSLPLPSCARQNPKTSKTWGCQLDRLLDETGLVADCLKSYIFWLNCNHLYNLYTPVTTPFCK